MKQLTTLLRKLSIVNYQFSIVFALALLLLTTAFAQQAAAQSSNIDMSDAAPPASGTGWTYADNVYTILNGADVIVSGDNRQPVASQRRIEVAAGATATITLNGVDIRLPDIPIDLSPFLLQNGANVTLILADGSANYLKAANRCAGLQAPSGTTLTINGGTEGTGSLEAYGGHHGAGIGGGFGDSGGNITINGGTVAANGGIGGAGIGGGTAGGRGGNITITGGTVAAYGGNGQFESGTGGGAGIGGAGGSDSGIGASGNITITGGTVTATGGNFSGPGGGGSGIGSGGGGSGGIGPGGSVETILIYGEHTQVTATAGGGGGSVAAQNIGAGGGATAGSAGNVFVALPAGNLQDGSANNLGNEVTFSANPVSNGTVTAELPAPFNTTINNLLGSPTVAGKPLSIITTLGANVVTFALAGYTNSPIAKTGAELMVSGATVEFFKKDLTISGTAGGWTYTGSVLTITTNGDYTIGMAPDVTTTADRIVVASGITAGITLNGVSIAIPDAPNNLSPFLLESGANVTLILADGSANYLKAAFYHAGLQAPSGTTLTINGGTEGTGSLEAFGGRSSAGIGGGSGGASGAVTITGGTVAAYGGSSGAGIGGGGGSITITGGTVVATGGNDAVGRGGGAGIGGSVGSASGAVTITGGTVAAYGGSNIGNGGGAGIGGGGGSGGAVETILIYGEHTQVTATAGAGGSVAAQNIGAGGGATAGSAGNVFVALPAGNLQDGSANNLGNEVTFSANPVSNGTVTTTLPAPFNTTINLLAGLATTKKLSVITAGVTQFDFMLQGYPTVTKTAAELLASGATVAFINQTTPPTPINRPAITGATALTLTAGYAATSTGAYTIAGTYPVTVSKVSGDPKITWNSRTETLDIAPGLTAGVYPVVLRATNTAGSHSLTFTLTVENPVFWMEIPSSFPGGTVTSSPLYIAEAGETVTLTITPDAGYVLESITVTDMNNAKIIVPLTCSGTTCTFVMPAFHINVAAVFKSTGTGVETQCIASLRAYAKDGVLYVTGLTPGATLYVYNILGTLIYQGVATGDVETQCIASLPGRGIYIVTAGKEVVKIVN